MEQFKPEENKEKIKLETIREALRKKVEIVKKKAEKNPACPDWMLADVNVNELTPDDLHLYRKGETEERIEEINPEELVKYRSEKIIPHVKTAGAKAEAEGADAETIERTVFKNSRVVFFDWMVQRRMFRENFDKHAQNVMRKKEAERNKNSIQGGVASAEEAEVA